MSPSSEVTGPSRPSGIITVCPTLHQLFGEGGAAGGIAVGAAVAVATNTVAKSVFISLSQFADTRKSAIFAKNASPSANQSGLPPPRRRPAESKLEAARKL